jgi:hypothetical protein
MTMSWTHGYVLPSLAASSRRVIMSAIRHPPSAIGFVIGTFLFGTVRPASAQDIGPVTFRDSIVMRQIVYRAPCPNPVPRAWTLVDSTLGRSPRCNLVAVAALSIAPPSQMRPPQPGAADPWNPLCVRVAVGENTGSTGLPGDWMVIFDLTVDRQAWVVIDRQTGNVGGVRLGYGAGEAPLRCMP